MLLARRRALTTQFNRPKAITFATLDPVTAYRYALSNNNTTYTPNLDGVDYYPVARSTSVKNSGKYYFENTISQQSSPGQLKIGVAYSSTTTLQISTNVSNLFGGARQTGALFSFTACAVDIDAGKVFIGGSVTGVLTWANSQNPVTGANPIATFTPGSSVFAVVRGLFNDYYYGDFFDVGTIKFSPDALQFTPPTGYTAGWTT